jgi:hypothetical protein
MRRWIETGTRDGIRLNGKRSYQYSYVTVVNRSNIF